jgi:hypothetical protein
VANLPPIGSSGADARATRLQQTNFGRVMRTTHNCAGTRSSISWTVSPIACNAPQPHVQLSLSTLRTTSSRGKCSGDGLRFGCAFGDSAGAAANS